MDPRSFATALQMRAADPDQSVWVGASAGTGKTKVLIERVLRLLLPRPDGRQGTRPDRILCLTYTKAVAAEMNNRLLRRLSAWSVMPEQELVQAITELQGAIPHVSQLKAARSLFTKMIDGPYRVRILTIHSFCHSILARFPIEAGLPSCFSLIEDQEISALLKIARQRAQKQAEMDVSLQQSLLRLYSTLSDESLGDTLQELFKEKRQLSYAFITSAPEEWRYMLCDAFKVPSDLTIDLWRDSLDSLPEDVLELFKALYNGLSKGGKTDQSRARAIFDWLSMQAERSKNFELVENVFFKKDGGERSNNHAQGMWRDHPDIISIYQDCLNWVGEKKNQKEALGLIELNLDLLKFSQVVWRYYIDLKRARSVLDYDDLIRYTANLLASASHGTNTLSWVMYKLDGGIDHILLDEAQDTNPEQWQIIRALVANFSDSDSSVKAPRTLFVVGDVKQSIYSFQGADAESFQKSLIYLGANMNLKKIDMNVSFRTTSPILNLVDHVCSVPDIKVNLRQDAITNHISYRGDKSGRVTIFPVLEKTEKIRVDEQYRNLAMQLAEYIRDRLLVGDVLPSTKKTIRPRDVMILVRTRGKLLSALIGALRQMGVPTSGLDRLPLMSAMIVQDLVSCAEFSLTPSDDLTLAGVLKSPFIGLTDDDLMKLAPGRSDTLWQVLEQSEDYRGVALYLSNLIEVGRYQSIDNFFAHILDHPCPADPDGSGLRAAKSRLGSDVIDPIHILRARARDWAINPAGLPGFIQALRRDNPEIKRDPSRDDDVVRVMTVHGAKGLEAPIVILPDTFLPMRPPPAATIFWPEQTGVSLPIWSPRAKDRPALLVPVAERADAAQAAEYHRLLYVAITRACDELVVAGVQQGKNTTTDWYHAVCRGMGQMVNLPGYQEKDTPQGTVKIYASTAGISGQTTDAETEDVPTILPDWLFVSLPADPVPARPLRPERASAVATVTSPLEAQITPGPFLRGLLTHKLLQVLPALSPVTRQERARAYLQQMGTELPIADHARVIDEVMAIINAKDLAPLFGPGSMAEVAVTGKLLDGRLVAGQIDRLVVLPDKIMIVDYKTNFPRAHDVNQVPPEYVRQLRAYRDLLAQIYPGHMVQCALLWTDGAVYMPIPDAVLDGAENNTGVRAAKTKRVR